MLIVLFLFSIGILVQDMPFSTKIRLVFTMFAIETYIMASSNTCDTTKSIKNASYGVLFGIIVSTIISIFFNISLFDNINDESSLFIFSKGFNGGILYKNYFASSIFCAFIGPFLYYKYNKKSIIDIIVMIVCTGLMVLSGSQGGILIFAVFVALEIAFPIIAKIRSKMSNKINRIVIIATIILAIIVGTIVFDNFLSKSATYAYRIKNKPFEILFGNSKIAFANDKNYVANIRSFLHKQGYNGYNGSYEMGFINAFIKNGLMGLIGYILCYTYLFVTIKIKNNKYSKEACILLITLLFSSLVESYVCSIHGVFGVFAYIIIGGLIFNKDTEKSTNDY